jgi:hypothetical protein
MEGIFLTRLAYRIADDLVSGAYLYYLFFSGQMN